MTNGRWVDNGRIWWIMYAMTRMASVALISALAMGCLGPAFTTAPDVVFVKEPDPVVTDDAGTPAVDPPAADAGVTKDTQSVPVVDAAPQTAMEHCLATCRTDGCCDADGICSLGTSDTVCGTQNNRGNGICVDCTSLGAFCNSDHLCQTGKTPTPSPTCGPNNCTGCCDSTGTCQIGNADTLCGVVGGTCTDCAANGNVCGSNGACGAPSTSCTAAACPPCTQGTPTCEPTCKCCLDGICL